MSDARPVIIIRKKKAAHGGHHGGAWKVAYADFVTAMMALFIVLWLMNSSKQVREAVGGYFKDPTGVSTKVGSGQSGTGDNLELSKNDMEKLKDALQTSIKKVIGIDKLKDKIEMMVTSEGLRVELLESEAGLFFASGDARPTGSGEIVLAALAGEIGKLPNRISIEGHTDARPFTRGGEYGNWELSADRANAARRLMLERGLRPNQVMQVRGFADQRLRKPATPDDPSNRRISLIIQHLAPVEDEDEGPKAVAASSRAGVAHRAGLWRRDACATTPERRLV